MLDQGNEKQNKRKTTAGTQQVYNGRKEMTRKKKKRKERDEGEEVVTEIRKLIINVFLLISLLNYKVKFNHLPSDISLPYLSVYPGVTR